MRLIGVGETLRRIVGKAVGHLTRLDIEEVCGVSQLCSGLKAGIEGGVHAIRELFDDHSDDGWGVMMVDPSNVVLWNSRVKWPRCSQYSFNTYRGWAPLVLKGSGSMLHSKEGITQGDPLSMFIYAIATLPLINTVHHPYQGSQVSYADDASACTKLVSLNVTHRSLSLDTAQKSLFVPLQTITLFFLEEKFDHPTEESHIMSQGL